MNRSVRPSEKCIVELPEFRIITAESKHASMICELHNQSFSESQDPEQITKEINNENGMQYLLAFYNDELIGYLSVRFVYDECSIFNIATALKYRKQNVASHLLDSLINNISFQETRRFILEVRISNTAAIELYTKHNFKRISLRKNYYSNNGEDALILIHER